MGTVDAHHDRHWRRSTIFLVFLAALFPIILNTVTAVEQVPERLLEAAAMLGTSKGKALWKVVFPAALPGIIEACESRSVWLGRCWSSAR
ncbi:MAG: ABC transporter permease subunit [Varibaculum sp.]